MLLNQLFEAITRTGKGDTAVVGWGRGMGHKGHMMLASSVITKAKEVGGDPYFVVSRTVGKDDPITPEEKLAIYKKVFPQQGHIFQAASDEIPDLTRVLANLNKQGYKNCVVVVGADQVKAFQYLKKYNGQPDKAGNVAFNFDNLDVISRQETNDPSKDQEGPRATPMRQVLQDPSKSDEEQFAVWRDAMSPEVNDDEVRDLMMKAKTRMAGFAKPKKEGVAEGFVFLSPKEKGSIQHVASRVSDIPGMWDFQKSTFTDAGVQQLRDVLKNEKYVKYALDLKADDFDEAFSQAAADRNKIKNQKSGRIGHGLGWKNFTDDPKEIVDGIVHHFDNITRMAQYDMASDKVKLSMVERFFKKYGYPFELMNDVIVQIERQLDAEYKAANAKESMLPKSAFTGSDKNKLGPAAHLKGKMKRPARQGDLVGEAGQRLDPKCWKGYRKQGTKMKGGVRVNNCVKVGEGWEQQLDAAVRKLFEGKK